MNPAPLRIRSFSKINLALSVLGKRADGFHEIRTVFQSIDLHDDIELRPSDRLSLHCSGLDSIPQQDNLVWRAADLLARHASVTRGAAITVTKRIPPAAGLGGGSGNAAATLLGLCRFWQLKIPAEELHVLARILGSDVPFFLEGGTALGVGRGEEVFPLPELETADLVVIYPGIQVSTAEAYRSLSLRLTSGRPDHRIQVFCGRLQSYKDCAAGIFNDFETSILPAYPGIMEARRFLLERGATAAMLSGSGSSVFGFFIDEESALAASRDANRERWRVFPAKTISRAEYIQRMFW